MIYWKFKYSRTQRALAVGVSVKSSILGKDIYPKLDFNKNNFIMPIPKLYKNKTNKGTVYSVGPIVKEEIKK